MQTSQAFIPFARPDTGEDEIEAVARVLRSGWLSTGPETRAFETEFAEFLGGDLHAIAVNSATAALHLALEAIGIGPGDEVIAPTLTFTATVEVARYLGADAVLVDVDPVTLNMDPARIEAAITPRTKAILPVHYSGLACDMDAIFAIAKRHDIQVIEDAAHALPSTYKGRTIGQLGSAASAFSFYANKTMTTAEGGMIVTRDADLAARMRVMRLHGISRDVFDRFHSTTPGWYYEIIAPGFKYNMPDISGALGRVQLRRLPGFLARRQQMAARYLKELSGLPLILPADAPAGEKHAWHMFVLRLSDAAKRSRDEVIQALSDAGIGTSVHYLPLHRQPYWRDRYGLRPEQFPVADLAYQRMLSIPLYTAMSDDDQARVIAALHQILG
ncbi:DegT/DnrJ/EryC1/StrS family aminotransferase [Ottowia sp. GY511]|uniref:DegT/DnrJ/EryC1/StrS family aminotransferase n=1 Tax=Ottowia flava TaxID=2675430 RepID=A0ABW4KSG5_9BURK|nr:DegT/DnrJ/EryC1/StrS family aminotransferase [Ottowia sp. GY511]TXK33627.1 DegT/DnrJ/EryC1/StrS family aminotransferase [Ottowia sp. GY511]